MKIIFRIAGYDGMASEDTVDNLVDDDEINSIQIAKMFEE